MLTMGEEYACVLCTVHEASLEFEIISKENIFKKAIETGTIIKLFHI